VLEDITDEQQMKSEVLHGSPMGFYEKIVLPSEVITRKWRR